MTATWSGNLRERSCGWITSTKEAHFLFHTTWSQHQSQPSTLWLRCNRSVWRNNQDDIYTTLNDDRHSSRGFLITLTYLMCPILLYYTILCYCYVLILTHTFVCHLANTSSSSSCVCLREERNDEWTVEVLGGRRIAHRRVRREARSKTEIGRRRKCICAGMVESCGVLCSAETFVASSLSRRTPRHFSYE